MTVQELQEKHAKELAELELVEKIMAEVPAWAKDLGPSCHVYKLYGKAGSITWKHDFYAYGKPDKVQPTLETVRRLAECFPPVPLTMVRDSCLSFQPTEYVASLPEEKKERWDSETEVAPFLVKLDAFQQRTVEVEWVARIAGMLVEVSVVLPHSDKFGTWDIVFKNHPGYRTVERCQFRPNNNLLHDIEADGEMVAQLQTPIRWGRGSQDVPNAFTLYWLHVRDDRKASPVNLVDALEK